MHLRKLSVKLLFLIVLSCAVVSVLGQACPTFEISGPEGLLNAGESYTLRVDAKGSTGIDGLKYEWTTSLGQIISGQGTKSITLSTSKDPSGQAFTASVSVSGISSVCNNKVEASFEFISRPVCGSPLDEFNALSREELQARIDDLIIRMQNMPGFSVVFELQFGMNDTNRQHIHRVDQILRAFRFRKQETDQVFFLISPKMETSRTMLWMMLSEEVFKLPNERGTVVSARQIKAELPTILKTN
ncbi:MAG: hypothetical protein JNL64_00720 [Blastocatellia bacterium]|nr:hypothetical protein [Blastocatellia bacterium]